MDAALALAGLALGAAAAPHCALMCGAPCAALTRGSRHDAAGFHAGRLVGYMAGGALAAASVSALGAWTRHSPGLQPLWTLLQLAFLALGLWWLATGRMPRRLLRDGAVPVRVISRRRRVLRASLAGLGWVAWPCGALQGALLLAALANGAAGGALVMGCFAIASAPGLAAAPWLWNRWQRLAGAGASVAQMSAFGYRVAGVALCATSAWALAETLRERIAGLCVS